MLEANCLYPFLRLSYRCQFQSDSSRDQTSGASAKLTAASKELKSEEKQIIFKMMN